MVIVEKDPRAYKIIEGEQTFKNFTFTIRETSDSFAARVEIYVTDLEDSSKGISIPANDIFLTLENGANAKNEFVVGAGETAKVDVSVKTQSVKAGTYEGKITVVGLNASDTAFSARIQISQPLWQAYVLNLGGILFGVVATIFGITIPKAKVRLTRADISKNIAPLIAGIVVVIVVFLGTVGAYYRTITDFGSNGLVDYSAAFLFGLGQYAAGNAGGTITKAIQERFNS